MTTKDFIAKHLNTRDSKTRHCSSVFTDGNGNFYSYGYHYPLIITLNGKHYINTKGYSSSTERHISWAWHACDYNAFAWSSAFNKQYPIVAASHELVELNQKLPTLRKTATRQKQIILARMAELEKTIISFA